jgi:hypothetical protein
MDSREKQISNSKGENEQSMEEKPRFFVDKPLSRMPFNRIKLSPSKDKQRKKAKTEFHGKRYLMQRRARTG